MRVWFAPVAVMMMLSVSASTGFVLTVIDDDTENVAAVERVHAVAAAEGVRVTFAALGRNLDREKELGATLRRYQAEGHEIASHGYAHSPSLWKSAAFNRQAIVEDIERAEKTLQREGFSPKAFVYPYGRFAPAALRSRMLETVGGHYALAFDARGELNRNGRTCPLYVARHPLRKYDSSFMTRRLIDDAADRGGWLVLLTHSGQRLFDPELLREAIAYAKERGAKVLPATAAFAELLKRGWRFEADAAGHDHSRLDELYDQVYIHAPLVLTALGLCLIAALSFGWYVVRRFRA